MISVTERVRRGESLLTAAAAAPPARVMETGTAWSLFTITSTASSRCTAPYIQTGAIIHVQSEDPGPVYTYPGPKHAQYAVKSSNK